MGLVRWPSFFWEMRRARESLGLNMLLTAEAGQLADVIFTWVAAPRVERGQTEPQ